MSYKQAIDKYNKETKVKYVDPDKTMLKQTIESHRKFEEWKKEREQMQPLEWVEVD